MRYRGSLVRQADQRPYLIQSARNAVIITLPLTLIANLAMVALLLATTSPSNTSGASAVSKPLPSLK
jgi:hypothetical protein